MTICTLLATLDTKKNESNGHLPKTECEHIWLRRQSLYSDICVFIRQNELAHEDFVHLLVVALLCFLFRNDRIPYPFYYKNAYAYEIILWKSAFENCSMYTVRI